MARRKRGQDSLLTKPIIVGALRDQFQHTKKLSEIVKLCMGSEAKDFLDQITLGEVLSGKVKGTSKVTRRKTKKKTKKKRTYKCTVCGKKGHNSRKCPSKKRKTKKKAASKKKSRKKKTAPKASAPASTTSS